MNTWCQGVTFRATENGQIIILSGFNFRYKYANDLHVLLEKGGLLSFNYIHDGHPKTVTGNRMVFLVSNSTVDIRGVTFASGVSYSDIYVINSLILTDNNPWIGVGGAAELSYPPTRFSSLVTGGKDVLYPDTLLNNFTGSSTSPVFTVPNLLPILVYEFKAVLFTASNVSCGVKVIMNTPTGWQSSHVFTHVYEGTTSIARTAYTTANPTLVATTALTDATIEITGNIKFSSWSNTDVLSFTVYQNTGGTEPVVLAGSYLNLYLPEFNT